MLVLTCETPSVRLEPPEIAAIMAPLTTSTVRGGSSQRMLKDRGDKVKTFDVAQTIDDP